MAKEIEVELYFYEGCQVGDAEGFYVQTYKATDPDWGMLTGSCTVSVDRPDMSRAEITAGLVDGLNSKKQLIRAETQVKLDAIDEKINNMLALEAPKEAE